MTDRTGLDDFVGMAPAIYCEGCGTFDVAACARGDAADEFHKRGWRVRMDDNAGYEVVDCPKCVKAASDD